MNNDALFKLLDLIDQDKITELEAERLLNAATRLEVGQPTGLSQFPRQQHTHTNH